MQADRLTQYAIINGTDKFGYHDYTPKYYRILKHLEGKKMQVLEVGVGGYQDPRAGGESLEAWRDFFTASQIVGFDLHEKTRDLGERITVLQGSQIDLDFLDDMVGDHGPFELIIDDGSHVCEHVVTTFEHLFPGLLAGGIYIIEDLQTAFKTSFGGSIEMNEPNHVRYFADVTRALHRNDGNSGFAFLPDVIGIERFHSIVVLYKKGGNHLADPYQNILQHKGVEIPNVLVLGQKLGHQVDGKISFYNDDLSDVGKLNRVLNEQGPFDLVIDTAGADGKADQRFQTIFPLLPDGTSYVVEGSSEKSDGYFHTLFAHLDHVAIAGLFPDTKIDPLAKTVLSIEGYPGVIALLKGRNDYPSAYNFDDKNPLFLKNLDLIREVLAEKSNEGGLCHHLLLAMRTNAVEHANFIVDRLMQTGMHTPAAFTLSAQHLLKYGNLEKAKQIAVEGTEKHKDDANIWRISGQILQKDNDYEGSITALEKAISILPKQSMTYSLLITALRKANRPDDAMKVAIKSTEIAPRDWKGWYFLGLLQRQFGKIGDAIGSLEQAEDLRPGFSAPIAVMLAQSYLGEHRITEARKVINNGLQQDPDNTKLQALSERAGSA